MLTETENIIKTQYEQQGYTVLHTGAPDFLIFKRNKNNKMMDIGFIEVKKNHCNKMSKEQLLWKEAIRNLNCVFKIEMVESPLHCNDCGSKFVSLYCRDGAGGKRWLKIRDLYCKNCEKVVKR
jgi:hypothetical protein